MDTLSFGQLILIDCEFTSYQYTQLPEGVKPFSMKDEWYYHMKFRDEMQGVTPILSALPPESTLNAVTGRTATTHMFESLFWNEKKSNMLAGYLRGRTDSERLANVHTTISLGITTIFALCLERHYLDSQNEVPKDGVKSCLTRQAERAKKNKL